MRGIHASLPPIKSPVSNKTRLEFRKQWTRPNQLFCPAASYGPCEIKGLSYIWSSKNLGTQDKNIGQRMLLKRHEFNKKETNASLTLLGGTPRNQYLTQQFLQKDVSAENMLQTNEYNEEELQISVSEDGFCVEDLQRSPSCAGELQEHPCSSKKLKCKEDNEKALICLPKSMPQNKQFLQRNTFLKMDCEEPWSLTPWVKNDSEDESIEEVACIAERKKREIKNYVSFQASAGKNLKLPKIGPHKQSHLQKTKYSTTQLKSSVLPFPLLGEKT